MKKLAYILALAVASSWTYAVAAENAVEKAVAPAEKAVEAKKDDSKAATGVRKPTGEVEKFWNALSWDELSDAEKKLWGVLGWNGKNWGAESGVPASESTVWDKLSKEEQAAATALGYDAKSWNKE